MPVSSSLPAFGPAFVPPSHATLLTHDYEAKKKIQTGSIKKRCKGPSKYIFPSIQSDIILSAWCTQTTGNHKTKYYSTISSRNIHVRVAIKNPEHLAEKHIQLGVHQNHKQNRRWLQMPKKDASNTPTRHPAACRCNYYQKLEQLTPFFNQKIIMVINNWFTSSSQSQRPPTQLIEPMVWFDLGLKLM